ncbi:hypothetical protein I8748_32055 [Nostoc sp. CENA67]|uniref:Uncharacterized protein n=1 Tax=Amazonocrinis nigriterrae CENA67 TaxID=2794033 RepID=A0A8J7I0J1_9NOST|nr:hypothetical protein [Amazonocrinis nigriterrae]MBH8566733.1 hypothetical protein [Amazonocrinis nigriterrae CENA67]
MSLQFAEHEYKIVGLYVTRLLCDRAIEFAENDSTKITDPQLLLELRDILETQYQDGITAIPQAQLNANDSFSGIFEDRVDSKLTKRFKFAIAPDDEISYSLVNPSDVEEFADSLRSASHRASLDFVAQKKASNCTKGIACGGSCISAKKTCRKNADAPTKKKIAQVRTKVKAEGSSSKPQKTKARTKVKAESGGLREKIKKLRGQYQEQTDALRKEYDAAKAILATKIVERKTQTRAEQKRFIDAEQALLAKEIEYIRQRDKLVTQELKKSYKDPQPQLHHGMSESEDMWSVEHEGVRYHSTGSLDKNHPLIKAISLDVEENDPLPKSLTRYTSDVYFSSQRNRDDKYWEKTYNIKDFKSAATGGNGSVVYYNGGSSDRGTLIHEMGHNLATGRYGATAPPESSNYIQAAIKDGDHPSSYGRNSRAEDFAETARMYHTSPDLLKEKSPLRYQVMKQILEDENFGG